MVRRLDGARKRTRHKTLKGSREKGKVSLTRFVQQLKMGEKVMLKAEPAYQKAFYNFRFHNRVATVVGKRGKCYEVALQDGGKNKTLIVHPVHLHKTQG